VAVAVGGAAECIVAQWAALPSGDRPAAVLPGGRQAA